MEPQRGIMVAGSHSLEELYGFSGKNSRRPRDGSIDAQYKRWIDQVVNRGEELNPTSHGCQQSRE